jgi:hypothetical protein
VEFVLFFLDRRGAPVGEPAGLAELAEYAVGLAREGRMLRAAPLAAESDGARVRVREGRAIVSDGPFAECKEVMGGLWIFEAAGRDQAIEIARRAFELGEPRPEARCGAIEVHCAKGREFVADPAAGAGRVFLLAYYVEHGLSDPDGSKMREMIAYTEELTREGRFLEGAPLAKDPAPGRIEARGGRTLAIDGPFAEVKEVVGGYDLVRAASAAEAVEIAKRCPHAKWGPVEVRELVAPGAR